MTDNSDPHQNGVEERIDGLLKSEWLDHELLLLRRSKTILRLFPAITVHPHLSSDIRT